MRPTLRSLIAMAGVAGAIYALPLFVPPPARLPTAPGPDASLWTRVFPDVPGAWMAFRLLALVGAAIAAGWAVRRARESALPSGSLERAPSPSSRILNLALAVAAAHAVCSLLTPHLGRAGQLLYLLALGLPAAMLALATRSARPDLVGGARRWAPVAAVVLAWLAWRIPASLHDPTAADIVDTWHGWRYVLWGADPSHNLLTDRFLPGVTGALVALQGAGTAPGRPPSFASVQLHQTAWIAVAALGVARLAHSWMSPAGAAVAAAVFLFAPFTVLLPLGPTAYFLGPLFAAGILVAADAVLRRSSAAGLAALGSLSGFAIGLPPVVPVAVLACGAVAHTLWRGPPVPHRQVLLAGCCFLAAALPMLPTFREVGMMIGTYAAPQGSWPGLEAILMGQGSLSQVAQAWRAGHREALDVPLGVLLSPFAVARTPLRLWGDALLEPVGALLAASGLAVCVASWRLRGAQALLAVLGMGLLAGITSSYDRPSHTRLSPALVPLALLAGVGFESLRRAWGVRRVLPVAAASLLLIGAGGLTLFEWVNPRILRASSLGIALRARAPSEEPSHAWLKHPAELSPSWLHEDAIASQVPRTPLPTLHFEGADSLSREPGGRRPRYETYFFSPSLVADTSILSTACERWPEAGLYRLRGRAGLSHAWLLRPEGGGWTPPLPPSRWDALDCPPPPVRDAGSAGP